MDYRQAKVPEGQLDVIALLRKGQLTLHKEREELEKERLGSLRGGSSGAVIDGEVYGTCHRRAHLRMKGISIPLEEPTELMTKQGEKNEDIWIEELRAAGITVKTQSDVGLKLELFGKAYYGSPDIALIMDGDIPSTALELKNLSSGSKAATVNNHLEPDVTHLIQAATYSVTLARKFSLASPLPYQLIYSSRSIWHVSALGEEAKAVLAAYPRDVQVKYGKRFSLRPFHRVYYLEWTDDGCMKYWTDGMADWIITKLTTQSIMDYYEAVAIGIEKTEWLGPRPTTKAFGKKRTYKQCSFCDLEPICNEHEDNYKAWMDHATLLANVKREERENI